MKASTHFWARLCDSNVYELLWEQTDRRDVTVERLIRFSTGSILWSDTRRLIANENLV